MPTCLSCGANLAPEWKYCIYCGARAATVTPRRLTARPEQGRGAIPAVIRPPVSVQQRQTMPVSLMLGIGGAVAGSGVLVFLAILLFGPYMM